MSRIRIFRWGDEGIPVGWMSMFPEPRQWLGYAAAGWDLGVSWVDTLEVTMEDGSRLIAGNEAPLPGGPDVGS
jgi:hypothetical protein